MPLEKLLGNVYRVKNVEHEDCDHGMCKHNDQLLYVSCMVTKICIRFIYIYI